MSLAVRRDGEGFCDSLSVDFADPARGAAGLVLVELCPGGRRARAAGLVLTQELVAASTPERQGDLPSDWGAVELDGIRLADDGERARVELDTDSAGFAIEVTRLGGVAFESGSVFANAGGVSRELFSARISGEWRADGSSDQIRCIGRLTRTSGEVDWERIELHRSLTATLEDGSLLAVASARPRGAAGHGEETASALLLDAEGSVTSFEEPLLSTEYDAHGRHRRAGVELWGSEEAALRGAGTLIGGAAVELDDTETAFLRFTLGGTPGTARYDLTRAS